MKTACNHSLIGLSLLLGLTAPVAASPLPPDAGAAGEGPVERRLNAADLALGDTRLELLPDASAANMQGQLPGTGWRSYSKDVQSFDLGQTRDPMTGQFTGSLQDSLRGFITVRRSSSPAPSAGLRPRASSGQASGADLGLDLGFSTNEWVRESVQGVVTAVLSLNVNARGEASFTVLGLGDFSVILAGDRSEIAFASGDDIVASARRTAHASQTSAEPQSAGPLGDQAAGGGPRGAGVSPVRQAIELVVDVTTHPLSFIVYTLFGGYALAWAILSARAKRIRHKGARRAHRQHSMFYAGSAAATVPAPAPKKVRKRIRMRVRVRKYR